MEELKALAFPFSMQLHESTGVSPRILYMFDICTSMQLNYQEKILLGEPLSKITKATGQAYY